MFFRVKQVRGVDYLQLVENVRVSGQSRQFVRLSLGRVNDLKKAGFFNRFLESAASLSNAGIFLSPGANRGSFRLSRDEGLFSSMFDRMVTTSGLHDAAHALARSSRFPGLFRRLLIETLFAAADRPPIDHKRLALLRDLGASASKRGNGIGPKFLVERALSRELLETRGKDLILSLRSVARIDGHSSLARGLVLATVMTESGAPISFEHCPAFWPVAELGAKLTRLLQSKFECQRVIVIGERALINPHFHATAFQRAGLSYILPVHENPALEATVLSSTELECREIAVPPEYRERNGQLRFIRCMHSRAAEIDSALRQLQINRLDTNGSMLELPRALAAAARRRLEGAEVGDGVSVVATNLNDPPQRLGTIFMVTRNTHSWERELTRFGMSTFAFEGIPRDADYILQGWSIMALLAHNLRHFLLLTLRQRFGQTTSWKAVQVALRDCQRLRVTGKGHSLLLHFENDTLMAQIFALLNLKLPNAVETATYESDDELIRRTSPRRLI